MLDSLFSSYWWFRQIISQNSMIFPWLFRGFFRFHDFSMHGTFFLVIFQVFHYFHSLWEPCYFLANCDLLITFANSFDWDQDRQNVGLDLDPNCWHSDSVPEFFFLKLILKKSADDNKIVKATQHEKSWVIFHAFCRLVIFLKIIFFEKFFQEYHQCQTVWIQIRPGILSKLFPFR